MSKINIHAIVKKTKNEIKYSVDSLNKLNPNIMVFIIYGLLYDMVINTYKPFAIKFLDRMGGNEFHISLYNSLPGLVGLLVLLPGSFFIARFPKKKNITCMFIFASRLCILSLAFVPIMPAAFRPMAFVALISIMNFPEALSQTSMQGFLGSVFNGRVRAQAISLRNKFGNFMIMVITLVMGLVISLLPRNDNERIVYYQVFFVVAFIIGLMEIRTFRKFQEEGHGEKLCLTVKTPNPAPGTLKKILRDKKFMRFTITMFVFQFTWQAGWPLCNIFQIKYLHADEVWLALFAVGTGIASFLSAGFWNKKINKYGNAKILVWTTLAMALNLFLYAVTPNLEFMILVSAYGGFSNIGVTVAMLNGLLGATPDEDRILYLGTYNTFVNLSLFLSPLAGNFVFEKVGIVWALVIFGILRCLSSLIVYLDLRFGK